MITIPASFRVAVLGIAMLASVHDAAAQQQPRTSRGTGDESYRTTLMLGSNLDVGQGADPSGIGDTAGADGLYTGGQFTLLFTKRLRRISFGAEAAKALRYYKDGGTMDLGDHAGVTLNAQFREWRFTGGQTIRRTPFPQLFPLVDGGGPAAFSLTSPDFSLLNAETTTFTTTAGVSRPLGRRAEMQFRYGLDESRQGSSSDRRMVTLGGGIRRGLTRGFDLRLGHTLRQVNSDPQSPVPSMTSHDLDLGVDYRRALSFSRRSTLTFSTGTAAVSTEGITQWLFTGMAALQQQIGRTWAAAATFDRRLNVMEGIPQPVVANGLTTTFGGMFGRRAGLRLRGSILKGVLGLPTTGAETRSEPGVGAIETFTTEARVMFTLWPGWQWYAEHYYYQHELANPGLLSQGVPSSLTRRGVRTGVELQTAILRRRR